MRQCFLWAAATVIFGGFLSIFVAKSACHIYIAEAEGKNWGPNITLTLLNRVVFKGDVTFSELRATFQNWSPASVMKPLAIAAAGATCFWGFSSWHTAIIKRRFNRQGNDKELLFQMECRVSILEKRPPLKVTGYFRAKNTLKMTELFSTPSSHIYKIYILQKHWSKSTNPALSSGLKKTLPRTWGHYHQLDDQDKELMIETKII